MQDENLFYKGKPALFIVNYEVVDLTSDIHLLWHRTINLVAIKDIYINENVSVISQYIYHPYVSSMELAQKFSCAIFIETYPEGKIPVEGAKGVRKTWLEGYSAVKEFYSPNYSLMPAEADYRRTLYWNPSVTPDENGIAKISFYNNSSCRYFSINAETVSSQGMIGILKNN
jgi:hypothetical protein